MYAIKNNLLKWQLGALIVSFFLSATPSSVLANQITLGGGGGEYQYKVKSFADRRFTEVIRQKYDFSCGSAAIATLLTHHYHHPVSEMDVLNAMFIQGDQEKIRREGFSLLDMKQYLNSIGYQAEGYKESIDKLARVGIPAIVLINKRGYMHFVVVKGVDKDRISVGDPTLGVTIYTRKEFMSMWNGILFVIADQPHIGKSNFNQTAAWRPYGLPEFRNMLDNGQLGSVTLSLAYSPNYYY